MPLYFFHVPDGEQLITQGVSLSGIRQVRSEALQYGAALLGDLDREIAHSGQWKMTVTDAGGIVLFKLTLDVSDAAMCPANEEVPYIADALSGSKWQANAP